MGSRSTFVLWRLGSLAFKQFVAIDLYSVNCAHVALYTGLPGAPPNYVVVALKSGPVETVPTVPVATALQYNAGV